MTPRTSVTGMVDGTPLRYTRSIKVWAARNCGSVKHSRAGIPSIDRPEFAAMKSSSPATITCAGPRYSARAPMCQPLGITVDIHVPDRLGRRSGHIRLYRPGARSIVPVSFATYVVMAPAVRCLRTWR